MAQPRNQLPSDSLRARTAESELAATGTPAALEVEEVTETRVSSPGRDAIRRFSKNWAAMISLAVILILIIMAAFAPFMHVQNLFTQDYTHLDAQPNAQHWFGTDGLGRDYYSRIIFGLRVPLVVGIVGTVITVIIGMVLGVSAGYFGGAIDSLLSRFTDLMFAFPGFTLALIVVSLYGNAADQLGFGGAGRVIMLVIVFALVGWPGLMRFVRSLALSMREQQFIEAARTSGTGHRGILFRHLLPNMYGLLLVQASFITVGFIYTDAVLSIFGLGVQEPNPDLGVMLIQGTEHLALNAWEAIIPSIFLTLLILAFTFFGDGVRDAVDPRARG